MNPTLLVIGYVWPEPDSSAAGSHMLSLLRLFKRQNWRVIFSTPAQTSEHMIDLANEGVESVEIQLNNSSFDQFISQVKPDYVLFDRFMMEEQFAWRVEQVCPNAIRILDTEDLQCLRGARQQALKNNKTMTDKELFSDLAKREIAAIHRCDLSLIISDFEINLLQEKFKIAPQFLHHHAFMLEPSKQPCSTPNFSQRKHFVTIGNFRHAPNWDSVLFLQQIWPKIRAQIPQAELHIYGSYPPKKATALNNPKTGFLIKGWAENAFSVLTNARVCLSPLRFGAGIKGKLIDAMQVGTPSVTTSIGSEGMCGDLPWPGCVADTIDEIVENAVALYQDESLWSVSQARIQPILSQRYHAPTQQKNLLEKIESIKNQLEQHRLDNFVGAMLNHHSMKSTQYMSKWIESKNQLLQHKASNNKVN